MAVEIERKFCVVGDAWRTDHGTRYRQGYLSRDPERTVRVRIADDQAFLTIKGRTVGASRPEFEYLIPLADAEHLLGLCDGPLIEKTRHRIRHHGMIWEVDEFTGDNTGLVIAEIELASEDQRFASPPWLGQEVTHDPRYYNANLSVNPYRNWRSEDAGSD
ncbi:MAG: CYTH domain-containing protein [Xanthomonadaceae bacterium]|nr:CYTH domain-containing protein [Xanthomonadaceae bacterium]